MCQRGGIPVMGAKVDMTTRRERISHRSLSLAYREVALASHGRALAVILIGYNKSETDLQDAERCLGGTQ